MVLFKNKEFKYEMQLYSPIGEIKKFLFQKIKNQRDFLDHCKRISVSLSSVRQKECLLSNLASKQES